MHHTHGKVLPRLPQNICWYRSNNKEEEEKSGKFIDLKKNSMRRGRKEKKQKTGRETGSVVLELQGPIKKCIKGRQAFPLKHGESHSHLL